MDLNPANVANNPASAGGPSPVPALLIGAATHPGQRRTHNEDSFCIADASLAMPENTSSGALRVNTLGWPKGSLMVLTDGVGGLGSGEIAAQTSARVAYQAYHAHRTEADDAQTPGYDAALSAATDASLRHGIQVAHESVRRLAQQHAPATNNSAQAGMASTIVMAVLHTRQVTVANVGDSRCYLLRAGQLQQLSTDHSWVAEQVRAGLLSPTNAEKHDYRNVLSQSVGATSAPPSPSLAQHAWAEQDRLLLCSDGLWGQLSANQLTALLSEGDDPQAIASRLVAAANAAGGPDNITAIVAFNQPQPTQSRSFAGWKALWVALPVLLLLGLGLMAIRNATGDPSATTTSTRPPRTATLASTAPKAALTAMPIAAIASPTPDAQPTATRLGQVAPTPALASAPANAAPAEIVFCRVVRSGRCVTSVKQFNVRNDTIFAVWKLDAVRVAEQIEMVWYRGGQEVNREICTLRGVGNTVQCAERGVSPTQASINSRQRGEYRLQVLIAAQPVLIGEFTVK